MKAIGIIAEFNPLHKGHEYFIREARERSGADAVVVVMSGDFVQRGEPAVWNKHIRAEAALYAGADLVLELPVSLATGSAAYFAEGAAAILDRLGIVDELWFGSEAGNLEWFERLSDILCEEPPAFSERLKSALKEGMPYPKARATALSGFLTADHPSYASDGHFVSRLKEFLDKPNNILGLEYCIALKKMHSAIRPGTIARTGSGYHDLSVNEPFCSAGAIRLALSKGDVSVLSSAMPDFFAAHFDTGALSARTVVPDDLSLLLRTRLLSESPESLVNYLDVSEDLARRIKKAENSFLSYTQFAQTVKSRNITYSHVSRALLHILLGIRTDDPGKAMQNSFVRVLAMRSLPALTARIRRKSRLKLCSRPVLLGEAYDRDLYASLLYETVSADKYKTPLIHEFRQKMPRLP